MSNIALPQLLVNGRILIGAPGSVYLPASLIHPLGSQQVRAGQQRLSVHDRKQHERAEQHRDRRRILWIDGFDSHRHRKIYFRLFLSPIPPDSEDSSPIGSNIILFLTGFCGMV